jgi:hypothetical protein
MIYMHKKSGELILINWSNDMAIHIQKEDNHGVIFYSAWVALEDEYEFIGEL